MNILFVIKNTANLRTVAPLLATLDERGHRIALVCKDVKSLDSREQLQQLVAGSAHISVVEPPFARTPGWSDFAASLRRSIDLLRYYEPRYRAAGKLRARAEQEAPPTARRLVRLAAPIPGAPRAVRRMLEAVERCLEPPAGTVTFLDEHDPDVLLITPLIGFGTPQADVVRAARRLGIPVGFPVRSWDNLTNKGLLRDAPDLVLVWNELQKQEAVELHGVPAGQVVVTGSPAYDHWFDWQPSRRREEFCAQVGLDSARPIVLYVGSSEFIAPDEPDFVRRWVAALRAHGGELSEVGVLVRPHPLAATGFREFELDDRQVAVWPRSGQFPLGDAARANYFDSIFHSAAVVGINTSAQIESAIVGRPVHTILAEEFSQTQAGTLHFRYLADEEFGHVRLARTLEAHAGQLERSLRNGDRERLNERFLLRFVRPFGLDVPATPLAADAVEELARSPRRPDRGPTLAPLVLRVLSPLAAREENLHRRRKLERVSTPLVELRRTVRDLARSSETVVAGPWTADEVGELLYWIPFLRWGIASTLELADRLVVVAKPDSAPWYDGLDVRHEPPAGPYVRLDTAMVERSRMILVATDPWSPLHERRLEFVRLDPAMPAGLDLPEAFLVVDAVPPDALPYESVPLAALPGPQARAAAVAGSRGFVGPYGATAVAAVLSGTPAVVWGAGVEDAPDLTLLGRLAEGPFGDLHGVDGTAEQAVERAVALLAPRATPISAR
jgi:hypothetical protein